MNFPKYSEVAKRITKHVGYRENPPGSNNNIFGIAYGMNRVAWCIEYIWCNITNFGKDKTSFPKTAYTPSLVAWAKKNKLWHTKAYKAKAGDIAIFKFPTSGSTGRRANHGEFVSIDRASSTSFLYDTAGNTSGSDPRNGGMVSRVHRSPTYLYGFVHIPYAKEAVVKPKAARKYTIKRVLKNGINGTDVKKVQKRLNYLKIRDAHGRKLEEDGKFGSSTEESVRKFQKSKKIGVDGDVGKNTATKLGFNWK